MALAGVLRWRAHTRARIRLTRALRTARARPLAARVPSGGLSAGALLAMYGKKVVVLESHDVPGGAAHAWERDGYTFESGPSLYSTMTTPGTMNPMGQVLQALGEELPCHEYNGWTCHFPEPVGKFEMKIGTDNFNAVLREAYDEDTVDEFVRLREEMKPLAKAAMCLPVLAVRNDPAALVTLARFLPRVVESAGSLEDLTKPYSEVMDKMGLKSQFIRDWLELCCFMLSGAPATGTPASEIGFMFDDWYRPNAMLEFPKGGSGALIDALVRGLEKYGGQLVTSAHVEEVLVENERAVGVRLRGGKEVRASEAVISNASLWDTLPLMPEGALPDEFTQQVEDTDQCLSFMHLHLGIDAEGLEDVKLHHMVVDDWEKGVEAERNVVLVSIPSAIDPSMAPEGKHVIHAYYPGTEPYEKWEGMDRKSEEYKALKRERADKLWEAVEKAVPGARERVEIEMIGTPLTCSRFLRRHRGTYGGRGWISKGEGTVANLSVGTPLDGFWCVGDRCVVSRGLVVLPLRRVCQLDGGVHCLCARALVCRAPRAITRIQLHAQR